LDFVKERFGELKDITVETSWNEIHKEKSLRINEQWNKFKKWHIYVIWIPEIIQNNIGRNNSLTFSNFGEKYELTDPNHKKHEGKQMKIHKNQTA
jgi:hypothetical protein